METAEPRMVLKNSTSLDTGRLRGMFLGAIESWPTRSLDIRIRYSRGSDFSGTCYYEHDRIYVNLGRHLEYPYRMDTYLARAVSTRRAWWKPLYTIELADGYQVVLFVLLHEYYHWLVRRAGRNNRQKESMCDRFAARILADRYDARIRDPKGRPVPREAWSFQDLEAFVASARTPGKRSVRSIAPPKPLATPTIGAQRLLFSLR